MVKTPVEDRLIVDTAMALIRLTSKEVGFPRHLTPDIVFGMVKMALKIEGTSFIVSHEFGQWIRLHRDSVIAWQREKKNG